MKLPMLVLLFFNALNLNVYLNAYELSSNVQEIDPNIKDIKLTFKLKPDEYIYKDSFYPSSNNQNIKLSEVTASSAPVSFFDTSFNSNKEGYKDSVTFNFKAQKNPDTKVDNVIIHTHFSTNLSKQPGQEVINLNFNLNKPSVNTTASSTNESKINNNNLSNNQKVACPVNNSSLVGNFMQHAVDYTSGAFHKWKDKLSNSFTSSNSSFIRVIVALFLGILLSLTPCIYPMIPITVGILQANQSSSGFRNFLLAGAYTLGISTTFAVLGLIAVFSSCVFGELQGSPFIIIPIVFVLLYLGFSMLGLYEMYIPRFLRPKTAKVKGGSLISAFIFGVVSGSVASPCASPGLTLILSFVSSLSATGSWAGYIEGFMLLFVFGIGSSLPLLIIGTFSTSLNMLPKAGAWMVEVKKLLGLMLFGMAFYYLSHLERFIPWYILVWVIVIFIFSLGVYYFMSVAPYDSKGLKRYKQLMGVLLIIASCIMGLQGYKAVHEHIYPQESFTWLNNYDTALAQALKDNKRLFIDIGATYCGACKSLDNSIFKDSKILEALNLYIPVKIESNVHEEDYNKIKKLFGQYITGFPTYLIIDPANLKVIKSWSVEIADLSINEIASQLKSQSAK